MGRDRHILTLPTLELETDRRRAGRLRTEDLGSTLGQVYDLSSSGIGVARRGRKVGSVGDTVMVRLAFDETDVLVSCRIIRIERLGFRRHRYGMQFIDLTPETQAAVRELAQICCDRKLFEPYKG